MCLPGTIETVRERAEEEGVPRVSRQAVLVAAAGAAAAAAIPARWRTPVASRRGARLISPTRFERAFPFTRSIPSRRTLVTVENDGFYAQEWTFGEHSGTHVDAPGHFISGGRRSPQLRPNELIAPAVVVDISRRAAKNPDAVVTREDLVAFERRHGRIPRNALVMMFSGWEDRVSNPAAYKNADSSGTYHFPRLRHRRRALASIEPRYRRYRSRYPESR